MIFNRCPGHRQTMIRLEQTDGFRGLGLRILDGLSLIENGVVKFELCQLLHIAAKGVVGRDHEIAFGKAPKFDFSI